MVPLKQGTGGVLIHGPDGDVYYIEDSALAPFELNPAQAQNVNNTIQPNGEFKPIIGATSATLAVQLGLKASDDEDTVTDASVACVRQPC